MNIQRLVALLLAFLAFACSGERPNASQRVLGADQDALGRVLEMQSFLEDQDSYWEQMPFERISLSRSGCYGTCPIYRVEFRKGGQALYRGDGFVSRVGKYEGETYLYAYALLCSLAERSDPWSLEDRYSAGWTDDATVTIELETRGGVKSIQDYGRQAPPEFQAFRALFDELAEEVDWVKVEEVK